VLSVTVAAVLHSKYHGLARNPAGSGVVRRHRESIQSALRRWTDAGPHRRSADSGASGPAAAVRRKIADNLQQNKSTTRSSMLFWSFRETNAKQPHLSAQPGLHKSWVPLFECQPNSETDCDRLLYGTAYRREDVVGVSSDQADGAYNDYQNHRQHYGVFGDILTTIVIPQAAKDTCHFFTFIANHAAGGWMIRGS